jgi:diguanylate cyclase (GGDEF)-like protein
VHYRQALALLDEDGALDDRQAALEGLSRVEESLGDLAAALQALREVRAVDRRKAHEAARNVVTQRELRIELAQLTSQWAQLATQDPLTGLGNRRALERWLAEQLPRVERGEPATLMLMDLDHFKQVNDRFGHDVGDAVLRQVAELIRRHCRGRDLAARYGGEEFLLALAGVPRSTALDVGERLREAVAGHGWQQLREGLTVTLSIGVAEASEAADATNLLTLADQRLYAAKHGGRNKVVAD